MAERMNGLDCRIELPLGSGGPHRTRRTLVCPDCKGRGRATIMRPYGRRADFSCETCHGSGSLQIVGPCGPASGGRGGAGLPPPIRATSDADPRGP